MDNFLEIKNEDVVKIAPRFLNSELENNILNRLKQKYEGVCSKFGYIKSDSIRVASVNEGIVESSTFHGYVNFRVVFTALICNPPINSVVQCVVKNINSFGILCTTGFREGNTIHNILNVIVPKQNMNIGIDQSHLENIKINDRINVEILGKKYILNNKSINVFGKIVDINETGDVRYDADELEKKTALPDDEEDGDELEDNTEEPADDNPEEPDTESVTSDVDGISVNDLEDMDDPISDIDNDNNSEAETDNDL